ncbi:calcium-binding protein [Natrinema sp. 74]|uniref:calcium-binding protein n=1 Tax=Natrinema sp. 74 TaxID=3384159 RepID=UPI0038D48B5F
MAKSALATGTLALGAGAFGTATVGAQQDQVAVFADSYYPRADFDVVAQLQASTTVDILQVDDEPVAEIAQPDEWSGHLIQYDIGQGAGITTFLFVRGQSLNSGDSTTIGPEASVLSSELNLLNTSLDDSGEPRDKRTAEGNQTANETATENGGG